MSRKPRAIDGPLLSGIPEECQGLRYPAGTVGQCDELVTGPDAWGEPWTRRCEREATWGMLDGRMLCTQHHDIAARACAEGKPARSHLRVIK